MLHRLGADVTLTLGNKKSVDIAVVRGAGNSITIDVKGLAGNPSRPVDSIKKSKIDHFVVFVCFNGKIADPLTMPEVWVVPSSDVKKYTYHSRDGKRHVVPRSTLRSEADKYKDAWQLVV